MLASLPEAWSKLVAEEDDLLLELVADKVESLCGFKLNINLVAKFLRENTTSPGSVQKKLQQLIAVPKRDPVVLNLSGAELNRKALLAFQPAGQSRARRSGARSALPRRRAL
jgi:hypothetical protein